MGGNVERHIGDDDRDGAAIEALQPGGNGMTRAARDVLAERQRQIEVEGWTPEHDDAHSLGQMAGAALCYLAEDIPHWARQQAHGCYWPWDAEWWNPGDHRRNLVKAGALILAEIERLDRATRRNPPQPSASVVEVIAACETVLIRAQEMCKAGHPVSAFNVATDALRALKGVE